MSDFEPGRVKFFDTEKGYGFVAPNNNTTDVFVHAKSVQKARMGVLAAGQEVEFTREEGRGGRERVGQIRVPTKA